MRKFKKSGASKGIASEGYNPQMDEVNGKGSRKAGGLKIDERQKNV